MPDDPRNGLDVPERLLDYTGSDDFQSQPSLASALAKTSQVSSHVFHVVFISIASSNSLLDISATYHGSQI